MASNHDYSKYMIMTLNLEKTNGITLERVLASLKRIDDVTFRVPKMLFISGFENKNAAELDRTVVRDGISATNPDSYSALIEFARRARDLNTLVSLEFEYSFGSTLDDFYPFYERNGCFYREPKNEKIQIDFKQEYISGLFERRFEKIFKLFPFLIENGTVMLDSIISDMKANGQAPSVMGFKNKIISVLNDYGVDVLTDKIINEQSTQSRGRNFLLQKIFKDKYDFTLNIPVIKSISGMSMTEIMKNYPKRVAGRVDSNKKCADALYTNVVELDDFIQDERFDNQFAMKFALETVPFFYLNGKIMRRWQTANGGVVVDYSDGTVSDGARGEIRLKGNRVKVQNAVCLPIYWRQDCYCLFSTQDSDKTINMVASSVKLISIDENGKKESRLFTVKDNLVTLPIEGEKLYFVEIVR